MADLAAFHEDDQSTIITTDIDDHGWQKVTYVKRQRKPKPNVIEIVSDVAIAENREFDVFRSLEDKAEDRRRRIVEAQSEAAAVVAVALAVDEVEHGRDSDVEVLVESEKKAECKPKKPKKPKVTVAEAANKIEATDLAAFLFDISGSYEGQEEIQLMRFVDYFGRAFAGVTAAQFPWMKIFREPTLAKITNIPLLEISDAVYKTSVDWIGQRSLEAQGSCILWSLDTILADLASHQVVGAKSSKKGAQKVSSKSQVAMFVVLALVLRRKPDVLVNLLPTLRENSKYQGLDKLPVIVWMIAQASEGDLAVGLHAWAYNLLPLLSGKSCNPQSKDLVLQLVERILSAPKAHHTLVCGPDRKGERVMPPSGLETIMRVTFPASSSRIKATERFEAVYPTLKEVALAGPLGSKEMKQVSQQILSFAVKAAGESIPELSNEATSIFIWCLAQNAECYEQWNDVYSDNPEASVAVLRKLYEEWKQHSARLSPVKPLRDALDKFRHQNKKLLDSGSDAAPRALFKVADKYCKALSGRISQGHGCMKVATFIAIFAVVALIISPNIESWLWKELSAYGF